MTTIGGVLFRHLDAMPKVGDYVSIEGFDLTVLEMDGHRIAEVQARKGVLGDEEVELPAGEPDTLASVSADKAAAPPPSDPDGSVHEAEVVALPTRGGKPPTGETVKQPDQGSINALDEAGGGDDGSLGQSGGQGR